MSNSSTIVMKFGGASVANAAQFEKVANIILERSKEVKRVVVVVSAMGNTTTDLLNLAHQVHPNPPQREQDMLVSIGERISISLLAMAIDLKGAKAVSFTGSQSGIITCVTHGQAKILTIKPHRILKALDAGKIVIVAGFQGVSIEGEITTLGRGGSDTTAVALGIALDAENVEFYKDVPGIFEQDPKSDPNAKFLPELNYDELLSILAGGAKVLHPRSVQLAKANGIPLVVRSFKEEYLKRHGGTRIEDERIPRLLDRVYEIQQEESRCLV